MGTFTGTLPDNLLKLLDDKSKQLATPQSKLIERAILLYLDHLNRAEFVKSYKEMAHDTDLLEMAEIGMEDYLNQLSEN
jgi:hypothetical protein